MSDLNETTRILNAESEEQMAKQREEDLNRMLKLQLVLNELKNMRLPSNVDLPPESVTNIEKAQRILHVSEYIQINNQNNQSTQSDDALLDLRECLTINLSYTERKAVREQLIKNLHKNLQPIADMNRQMREEIPEIFMKTTPNNTTTDVNKTIGNDTINPQLNEIDPMNAKILMLEDQRRNNIKEISELKARKLELLKKVAELKLGTTLAESLEITYDESRLHQLRANALRGFLTKELVSNQNSIDAIKEIETYVKQAVEDVDNQ